MGNNTTLCTHSTFSLSIHLLGTWPDSITGLLWPMLK
jgi:hypothetical protein